MRAAVTERYRGRAPGIIVRILPPLAPPRPPALSSMATINASAARLRVRRVPAGERRADHFETPGMYEGIWVMV